MKYWSALSFCDQPLSICLFCSRFLIVLFYPSLFLRWGFIFHGGPRRSGKQTSSEPMTGRVRRSRWTKRPFGMDAFQRPWLRAALRCQCPLKPQQCWNMMKKDTNKFSGLAILVKDGSSGGERHSIKRSSDGSLWLCVWCGLGFMPSVFKGIVQNFWTGVLWKGYSEHFRSTFCSFWTTQYLINVV